MDYLYFSIARAPGDRQGIDTTSSVVRCAVSGVDGSLSACASAAGVFSAPSGIAFSGNWAYVTPGAVATDVDVCAVAAGDHRVALYST